MLKTIESTGYRETASQLATYQVISIVTWVYIPMALTYLYSEKKATTTYFNQWCFVPACVYIVIITGNSYNIILMSYVTINAENIMVIVIFGECYFPHVRQLEYIFTRRIFR